MRAKERMASGDEGFEALLRQARADPDVLGVVLTRSHAQGQSAPALPRLCLGMYRWHVMDPIRFAENLRVTIQALGWRSPLEGQKRYLPLQDDIASTALWYQTEPHAAFPTLPDLNGLEVV